VRNAYFTLIIFRLIKANEKESFPQEMLYMKVIVITSDKTLCHFSTTAKLQRMKRDSSEKFSTCNEVSTFLLWCCEKATKLVYEFNECIHRYAKSSCKLV